MQVLESWGGCLRRDDIRACVPELAGNAVRHDSPDGRNHLVRLIRHTDCLHLEVHDSARRSRVRIPPPPRSGRPAEACASSRSSPTTGELRPGASTAGKSSGPASAGPRPGCPAAPAGPERGPNNPLAPPGCGLDAPKTCLAAEG
ncbi:ATP-binding protein [Streptomyces sp. NPDC002133]|uniref:ATP-binding protein n=1 Tax=Streptomyces sp. NPDC002133 TaxID=3154409 RepID=UPI00331DF0AA